MATMIIEKLMYKVIIIIFILGLGSCGTSSRNIKINQDIGQLENKILAHSIRKSNLEVMTPFTVVVSSFFRKNTYQRHRIADIYNDNNGDFSVANYLSVNLSKDMAKKYNLILKDKNNKNASGYRIKHFTENFKNNDYIIDNYVSHWRVMYYKFKFDKYYVMLATEMRLIDAKSKKIISKGMCAKETQYDKNRPLTFDTLFNNNSKILIEETKKLANSCLKQYKKLLKI